MKKPTRKKAVSKHTASRRATAKKANAQDVFNTLDAMFPEATTVEVYMTPVGATVKANFGSH